MSEPVAAVSALPAATPAAGSVLGMVGALLLVVALIFALAWLARRVQNLRGASGGMQVHSALPLGTKEKIVLVRVGEEHFLLGVAGGGVSLLHRYETKPVFVDQPLAAPAALSGFAARLREHMGKK